MEAWFEVHDGMLVLEFYSSLAPGVLKGPVSFFCVWQSIVRGGRIFLPFSCDGLLVLRDDQLNRRHPRLWRAQTCSRK